MTTLKRTFNLETRTLKSTDKCYVGQVYDHISTTLEFSYNPINALTDGGYTAYIVFDLCDDNGDLFVFGPGSSPRFDGRTFEIPTSVTSRIKTQRLDYQLWLIKNRLEWNGRIDELGDTEYLFSAKDTLAFKPTSRCRCPTKDPCRPPQPNLEPGTLGWINYLRDHCILTPIQESYGTLSDGSEGVTLNFPTYNEDRDQALELHIPYLDAESKLDIHTFLRIVEEYNPDVTHDQIMTALCVQNLLDEKVTLEDVIDSHETPWDEYKDTKMPLSARLARVSPIGPWDPTIEYTEDSLVIHKGIIFISQGTFNIGHEPTFWHFEGDQDEDFEWWVPIKGTGAVEPGAKDVSTYVEIVGPDEYEGYDEATGMFAYRVYHHFNTSDLYVQARTNGSDREDGKSYTVNAVYDVSDHNMVRVLLSEKLEDDDIVVYISPGGGIEGEYAKQSYQALAYKDQPEGYAGLDKNTKLSLDEMYIAEDIASGDDNSYLVNIGTIRRHEDSIQQRLDAKLDDAQLVQTLDRDRDKIPSTQLLGTELDKKLDDTQLVQTLHRSEEEIPSTALLGQELDRKLDVVQLVQTVTRNVDDIPSTDLLGKELDLKTDVNMAIPAWDQNIVYKQGASVIFNGTIFISQIDGNFRVQPVDDEGVVADEWTMVQGGGGAGETTAQRFVIGTGTAKSIPIEHCFGTKDVFVSIREKFSGRYVQADVTAVRAGALRLDFAVAPAKQSLIVSVSPAIPAVPEPEQGWMTEIMNNSVKWEFQHDLHRPVTVFAFDQNGVELIGNVKQDVSTFDKVTIEFNQPVRGTMVVR